MTRFFVSICTFPFALFIFKKNFGISFQKAKLIQNFFIFQGYYPKIVTALWERLIQDNQIMPFVFNSLICSGEYWRLVKISMVCCPNCGAGRRTFAGVWLILTGNPRVFTFPDG